MITKDNLKDVLIEIGFNTQDSKQYVCHFDISNCDVVVDFKKETIKYPDNLKYERATTLNFSENENFVVLECVCRLLKQGYKPEHLYLEAPIPGGHTDEKAGFSDILIRDNNETPYMIIECKTTNDKSDDEFLKEWAKTKKSGGQLFNYFNTYRQAKYLVLYTSDFESSITPIYHVITLIDNDEFLKSNSKLTSYRNIREKNGSHIEYFSVWKNTYQQDYSSNGVLEHNIEPFCVGNKKLSSNDLIEIDYSSMKKKYNQYATILRQYNVSGKENAFDKLINIFIAKIIDETLNSNELKCYWKGAAYDNYYDLHDRLSELYKIGMESFFNDRITYIENSKIEDAFRFIINKKDEAKATIYSYIRELKYFNNNPFAILDVHNEELFYKNSVILKEVVRMLQDLRLKSDKQNQFLGDLFEGFLDQGIKQSEGQFFTPMPIVRFLVSSLPIEETINKSEEPPKVIDYACGAGHFLTEYACQIKPYVENKNEIDIHEYYKSIIGIEKEYRLSKVSQVSTFMYGQDGIRIRYKDALSKEIDGVENGSYSILIANPPYSVKGFLETLEDDDLNQFQLTQYVSDRSKNDSIELFFVEKAKQLLKDNGIAAIILPITILSNGGIYITCREILFKYFEIIAIVALGSKTFGKTNTKTATLFLRKREEKPDIAKHLENRIASWFNGEFSDDVVYDDDEILKQYCEHIGVDYLDYKYFLTGELKESLLESDIFSEYIEIFFESKASANNGINQKALKIKKQYKDKIKRKKYAELSDEAKEREELEAIKAFITEIERDKLYYYMLLQHNRNVVVVRSPKKDAEQKKFLGYEFSDAKGNEGISYINNKKNDDEDATIDRIRGIDNIITPLFDPHDLKSSSKINTIIRNNFTQNGKEISIPEELFEYVSCFPMISLMDFNKASFNKTIKLTGARKTIIDSDFELEKIKALTDSLGGLWTGKKPPYKNVSVIRNTNFTFNGEINLENVEKIDAESRQLEKRTLEKGDIILEKSGGSETQAVGRVVLYDLAPSAGKYTYSNFTARLRIKESRKNDIKPEYLHAVLSYLYLIGETFYYQSGSSGLQNLSLPDYLAIKIPVPKKNIQDNIINGFININDKFRSQNMTMEKIKNKYVSDIKDLFLKFGVIKAINE